MTTACRTRAGSTAKEGGASAPLSRSTPSTCQHVAAPNLVGQYEMQRCKATCQHGTRSARPCRSGPEAAMLCRWESIRIAGIGAPRKSRQREV
eukprot:2027549-Rhodomonas_salina.4